jgi:hypothetical protein
MVSFNPVSLASPRIIALPLSPLAQGTGAIALGMLQNATYKIPEQGSYTLSNGSYQSGTVTVNLIKPTAIGDVNQDGVEDAAVILAVGTGGSATFEYLAVVTNQNGSPVNLDTYLLGDRVRVQTLSIKNGQVRIKLLKHKDTDPLCCPTNLVIEAYQLNQTEGTLAPITLSEEQRQQVYVEDLPTPAIDNGDNAPVQPPMGEFKIQL